LSIFVQPEVKQKITEFAFSLGFAKVGFADCGTFFEEEDRLATWFFEGRAGPLGYLSKEKMIEPRHVFSNAKSAIVVFFPYARPEAVPGRAIGSLKLSRYLWGPDYHRVLKFRLLALREFIQGLMPGSQGVACVDTAPIMERALAVRAGLGWQGKNTLLLAGKHGSWGFLGVLLLDFKIQPCEPFVGDRCGKCTRCIDACPTKALEPFRLDCRHCITTWTIERPAPMPIDVSNAISEYGWIAGCDICQEVCPWNRAPAWGDPRLWGGPSPLHVMPASELRLTSSQWKKQTAGTALRRVRHTHWMTNLDNALRKNFP
jgi:epoxyqueuosine reductase